jgi:hypothetical protein
MIAGYFDIGLDASQSNDLICNVCWLEVALPQTPATVHWALISYGMILILYISFLLILAPWAIPNIYSKYRGWVYFLVIMMFKSRIP